MGAKHTSKYSWSLEEDALLLDKFRTMSLVDLSTILNNKPVWNISKRLGFLGFRKNGGPAKRLECRTCSKCFYETPENTTYCSRDCQNMRSSVDSSTLRFFKHKINNLRGSAKNRNIDFNLTYSDLVSLFEKQKGVCFYTKIPMMLETAIERNGRNTTHHHQLSVDRRDPTKGYTKENIVLCTYSINNFKGSQTMEEFKRTIQAIKRTTAENMRIVKIHPDSVLPKKAHPTDAAYDIFASENIEIPLGTTKTIATGLKIKIPDGFYAQILTRSSMAVKGLFVSGGVIDSGYTGEWRVIMNNFSYNGTYLINKGDKIAQFVVLVPEHMDVMSVDELSDTDRGTGGFGSTGV